MQLQRNTMTVSELIAALLLMPPNDRVAIDAGSSIWTLESVVADPYGITIICDYVE